MAGKFKKIWILLFLTVSIVLLAKTSVFSQATPSLKEVLVHQKKAVGFDLSMLITSLLAVSLASISVAKGYEILKRNQPLTQVVIEDKPQDEDPDKKYFEEKIEELNFDVEELNKELGEIVSRQDLFKNENEVLKNQLKKAAQEFSEMNKIEQMIRKSNVELSGECGRLRIENEKLVKSLMSKTQVLDLFPKKQEKKMVLTVKPAPKNKNIKKAKKKK